MNSNIKVRSKRATCCIRRTLEGDPFYSAFNIPPDDDAQYDLVTQFKLKKAKTEVMLKQKHTKANMDYIQKELENGQVEIQNIKKAIDDLEAIISKSLCKTKHPKKLSDLCKVKSCLKIELSNVLQLQTSLKRQLCEARLAYRNARLEDHVITEDIKIFKEHGWTERLVFRDSIMKERLRREVQSQRNAKTAREDTITSVANSITAHVLQMPDRFAAMKNVREAKTARVSVGKYIAKTIRQVRENKAIAMTESQLRQRRQMENLAKLKREINCIKKTLTAKNHLKRMHDEEIATEKEEVKTLLLKEGANPYLAEYLLAIEEKQREVQRKMLVEEQKRLLDIQREYAIIEANKAKEETDRKKWESYWSKRAKDKVLQEKKSKMEMYFDFGNEEDETRESMEMETGEEKFQESTFEQQQLTDIEDTSNKGLAFQGVDEGNEDEGTEGEPEITEQKQKRSRQSVDLPKRNSANEDENESNGSEMKVMEEKKRSLIAEENPAITTRKAVHLDFMKKQSLLNMAGESFATTGIILMDGTNVFDFGQVRIGDRKYVFVNVANISVNTVKLKMSVINPYGPFTFCNALKDIPSDNFYTLKFRYQPTKQVESRESLKIEEVGNPENFIVVKLKGCGIP